MPQDIEQAFLNTVLAFKLMAYSYSLKCFFKDDFKKGEYYVIPFSHIFKLCRKTVSVSTIRRLREKMFLS